MSNFKDEANGISFTAHPTPTFQMDRVFENGFIDQLQNAVLQLPFDDRYNDLFKFKQSKDIKHSTDPLLTQFRNAIYSKEFIEFLSNLTGMPLSSQVDISCQRYAFGDHLLCHDDELEGRRIAFILYLVDSNWTSADGGSLDFFSSLNGKPSFISHSVTPCRNRLVFFPVSSTSFHQVSQVLSPTKERVSIGGWFHLDSSAILADNWINGVYLTKMNALKSAFESEASIKLNKFLRNDRYQLLKDQLMAICQLKESFLGKWKEIGPANYCHYSILEERGYMPFMEFLKSFSFKELIDGITDWNYKLDKVELCSFSSGCYTLLNDEYNEEEALDVYIFITGAMANAGGTIYYQSQMETLLEIEPADNSLALVLRDSSTRRFLKFVNSRQVEYPILFFRMAFTDESSMEQ